MQSVTWISFAFQSKQPSGTQWLAMFRNSSCCARWGNTRILLLYPEGWGVSMAPGHGLQLLFPSSEGRKLTSKLPTKGQTGLMQGW